MDDSFSSPGIDLPSPTLSARLRELALYLAAPTAGRLTEEQRALTLGIARRLVVDAAARLDPAIDSAALWHDWLTGGIPGAEQLAAACFGRAEEHRWRDQAAQRAVPPPLLSPDHGKAATDHSPAPATAPMSDVEQAYLALQIADRRRFDALGNPSVALADLGDAQLRSLLLDIAAWRLMGPDKDAALAAALGEAVRSALTAGPDGGGIDRAADHYHGIVAKSGALSDVAARAIARHDWTALIALAAAAHRRSYGDMALTLVTAEAAALPSLLAPLRLDRMALAPIEASLAALPARAIAVSGANDDDGAGLAPSRADGPADVGEAR